ncbi:MAG: enoyl-CoA hydratase/isomerase family protein [Proteobacteria bacterium]|nr:enoyl-CoA hydratase/isomerase family protein [Pseudomonadota bacterium]
MPECPSVSPDIQGTAPTERKNFGKVLLEREGAVSIVTLNRPERRNAFGEGLREDLVEAMAAADADSVTRAIILTGAGNCFCAGGDLKEILAGLERDEGRPLQDKTDPPRDAVLLSVYESRKPVIAAVNGAAFGAGMNLALAADIRIASSTALFGQSHVTRGLMPDYAGTYLLPQLVGHAKACELIYTGAMVDAQQALHLRMVNTVVDPEQVMPSALAMAKIIARNAPLPIRLAKRALQRYHQGGIHEALDRETAAQNICYDTQDGREGLMAFVEKREPVFHGR